MKVMFETEYWLEEIRNLIDEAEAAAGVTLSDDHYSDIAKELRSRVKSRVYFDRDVEVQWSYQQSVGAFVLVQSGTDSEREAFDAAVEAEREWVSEQVRKEIDAERAAMAEGGE